jgi:hypothetical protein
MCGLIRKALVVSFLFSVICLFQTDASFAQRNKLQLLGTEENPYPSSTFQPGSIIPNSSDSVFVWEVGYDTLTEMPYIVFFDINGNFSTLTPANTYPDNRLILNFGTYPLDTDIKFSWDLSNGLILVRNSSANGSFPAFIDSGYHP